MKELEKLTPGLKAVSASSHFALVKKYKAGTFK